MWPMPSLAGAQKGRSCMKRDGFPDPPHHFNVEDHVSETKAFRQVDAVFFGVLFNDFFLVGGLGEIQ